MALLSDAAWVGLPWDEADLERPVVLVRRSFVLEAALESATVEVTALGLYGLWLDGEDVSPDRLGPGWTDPRRRVRVQRLELGRLEPGEHVIGMELAEGWWSGHVGYHRVRNLYGDRPWGRAALTGMVEGAPWSLSTGRDWQAAFGAIRQADLLDGEVVDLRLARDGWSRPGGGGGDDGGDGWRPVEVGRPDHGALVADRGPPVRIVRTEPAVEVTRPLPGVQVVDLGRNLAGHVRLRLRGEAGREVALRHGEALEEDGTLYRANLREARQTDRVVLAGDEVVWEPRFTTHGFRYVEVHNAEPLAVFDVEARVVHTDMERVGWFECSDSRVNRLHQLLTWSIESNSIGLPTDCPQRDERLGWLEDTAALLPTRAFLYDHLDFLARWMDDVRDAQDDVGMFPDVAPRFGSASHPLDEGAPGWADAGVQVPWLLWQWYGDLQVVHDNLDAAARFLRRLYMRNKDGRRSELRGADYGDWLGFLPASKDLVAQAHAVRSFRCAEQMARAIGQDDIAKWTGKLGSVFADVFREDHVDAAGHVGDRSASASTFALAFDLLAPSHRRVAVADLVAHVRRHEDAVTVGYLALPHLLHVLTAEGHADVAYDLLFGTRMPGWMHLVDSGATSLWERWDSWTAETGFHQAWLNSMNHASLGVVGDWLHATVAGIAPAAPGWDVVRVDPHPGGGITAASARHVCRHGEVAVEWEGSPDRWSGTATIPAGTTAVVPDGRRVAGPAEVPLGS